MNIVEFREWLDERIGVYLDQRISVYQDIPGSSHIIFPIDHVKRLAASGKRIRAYMAFLGLRVSGEKDIIAQEKIFIGLELFHLFCLVHDDVIDKGGLRRGVPTVHEIVKKELQSDTRVGDIAHLANGQAILVGDLLFQWAQECFQDAIEQGSLAQEEVRHMIDEVVIGQMIDVDLMSMTVASNKLVEQKMLLKTAGYTFIRPLRIGLLHAGASQSFLQFADDFGRAIGLAFQIQDDMLDIVGGEKVGKTVLSDVQDGQHTYFTNEIFERGTVQQKERLSAVFGKRILPKETAEVISLFIDSGAVEAGRKNIETEITNAREAITSSPIAQEGKDDFLNLVELIEQRSS